MPCLEFPALKPADPPGSPKLEVPLPSCAATATSWASLGSLSTFVPVLQTSDATFVSLLVWHSGNPCRMGPGPNSPWTTLSTIACDLHRTAVAFPPSGSHCLRAGWRRHSWETTGESNCDTSCPPCSEEAEPLSHTDPVPLSWQAREQHLHWNPCSTELRPVVHRHQVR